MAAQWSIIREPDDNIAEVRISVGKPPNFNGGYIVFRGDPVKAIALLMKATEALWEAEIGRKGEIEDRRGRPQG